MNSIFLALVHLLPSWLVLAEIKCTLYVTLTKRPITQFKPDQQSRQQALRAYCPNISILWIQWWNRIILKVSNLYSLEPPPLVRFLPANLKRKLPIANLEKVNEFLSTSNFHRNLIYVSYVICFINLVNISDEFEAEISRAEPSRAGKFQLELITSNFMSNSG